MPLMAARAGRPPATPEYIRCDDKVDDVKYSSASAQTAKQALGTFKSMLRQFARKRFNSPSTHINRAAEEREYIHASKIRHMEGCLGAISTKVLLSALKHGQVQIFNLPFGVVVSFPSNISLLQVNLGDKLGKTFCPVEVAEGNPCLEYIKYIVFPWFGYFEVPRKEENGGSRMFQNIEDVMKVMLWMPLRNTYASIGHPTGGRHSFLVDPMSCQPLDIWKRRRWISSARISRCRVATPGRLVLSAKRRTYCREIIINCHKTQASGDWKRKRAPLALYLLHGLARAKANKQFRDPSAHTHAPSHRFLLRGRRRRPPRVPAPSSPHADARAGSFCGRRRRAHGGAAAAHVLRAAGDLGGGEQLRGRAGGVPADGAQVPPGRLPAGRRQGAHPPLHPGPGGLRDALRPRPPQQLRPGARPRGLPPRLRPRGAPPRHQFCLLPPGAGREVQMEDILGRPDRRAKEEEHREGF